ncbi:MAG: UDP-N-acetylmuramoyl-tripeptide--D-alanyl-D-alanine ligase, partial [Bacteroidetes bacterium]|nr:UDP-N-acetylmuramoyl-tripeptide--D-alanyl-D-alanine ligase [Bacteroidota bacterium]
MSIESLYALFQQYPHVETDTRQLKPGCIFFALRGENFNGNQFAKKALEAGAAAAIIDDAAAYVDKRTILVENTLTTLQQLAKFHRQQFNIPFIAITGSNGKTTSKELVHAVLASSFRTYTTQGNLNNHIGIPLTLLRVHKDAELAVIEMGANHQQEIAGYCTYTLPTHGIITNCGKAHLEGFGGVEGVRKGKGELYDFIRANQGTIFLNQDLDYLHPMSMGISNIVTYGTLAAQTCGNIQSADPYLNVTIQPAEKFEAIPSLHTQLVGDYNLSNVLLAVSVGRYFGVTAEKIKKSIEHYQPTNSRSQLIQKNTNTIILDAYNANPSSMQVAIQNFSKLEATQKVLLLGSMAELGAESQQEHQQLVNLIHSYNWKEVVLVGDGFGELSHPYIQFKNSNEAAGWFRAQNFSHTHFLIKGSRSMKMETILIDPA